MRAPISIILAALALAGCNTTEQQRASLQAGLAAGRAFVAATPKLARTANKLDAAVAKGSAKLASYCPRLQSTLVQGTVSAGATLTSGKVSASISAAKVISDEFCAHPPGDIVSAALLVEAAMADLTAAGLIAPPHAVTATPMALHRYHLWVARRHRA